MKIADYPALYRAADEASNKAQANLLLCHKISTIFLVVAVLMSLEGAANQGMAIVSAICFIGSLLAFIYGKQQRFQERWYQARALSESIKTASWRLIMAAEPFMQGHEEVNLRKFQKLLFELLTENKGIGADLSSELAQESEITTRMIDILHMPFEEKKKIYLEKRIDDQRDWYAEKSGVNRKCSLKFFWFTVAAYGAAIIFLIVRIMSPEISFIPVDVFAIIASGLIGWMEIKRFNELTSAYSLTAHEVGIIKSCYKSVTDTEHLSKFVSDAENAFSREHTQWAARRDH